MLSDHYPLLSAGTPLRREKLLSLRDFPRDWVSLQYNGYSDGIVCGCSVSVLEAGILEVAPGIVRHMGRFYMLQEPTRVSYSACDEWQLLKAHFLEAREDHDFERHLTELVLDADTTIQNNEVELCRFKLKRGAILRDKYQDFADMGTEFDTLNILHAPFAGPNKATISPTVLWRFASEAAQYHLNDHLDFAFCSLCLQGETVSMDMVMLYITQRLRCEWNEYENGKVHELLVKAMRLVKDGGRNTRQASLREKKIFLE